MSEEELNQAEAVEEEPKKKTVRRKKNIITGKVDEGMFSEALSDIATDSMVDKSNILEILRQTMIQAYLEWSYPGLFRDKNSIDDPARELVKADVEFDAKGFKIYDIKTVTPEEDIVDDSYQISPEDALEVSKKAKVGDIIRIPFDVSRLDKTYVRRVKQLFQSKLKEESKKAILSVYQNQIGQLIEGTVTKADIENSTYEVSFGKANGTLRKRDLIPSDRFMVGERITVFLETLDDKSNPPSLKISRSSEKFILKLLERNIIELQNGDVVIKGIAREAGRRTKVFVEAKDKNIDPVGACIGPESSRINAVLSVIRPEKIDILPYYSNKALQVVSALTPAKVIGLDCPEDFFDPNVHYDELEAMGGKEYEFPKVAAVVQNGDQGVAIGSKGANVRLASILTKTTISVYTADDAITKGIKYTMLADIEAQVKAMEEAQKQEEQPAEAPIEAPAEETAIAEPVEEQTAPAAAEEAKPEETAAPEVKEEPKAVEAAPAEEAKPIEEPKPVKKEEPIEHVEIKNKPKISLSELEDALSTKKGPSETRSRKHRYDRDEDKKEDKENTPSAASRQEAMPIYTEEELAQIEQEQNDNTDEYDDYDDDELDQYDSDKYYDDDSNK